MLFPDGNENLWDFLQEVYPKHKNHRYTIQEIINSWLSARYHPELRIQRIVGQSKVEYYYYSSFPIKSPETKWKIPITYMALTNQGNINSYNTSDIIWFEFSERKNLGTIKPEDSFIVNLDQMGKYISINLLCEVAYFEIGIEICVISCVSGFPQKQKLNVLINYKTNDISRILYILVCYHNIFWSIIQ